MHIRAQNAALIVRRLATADVVQFEVFEVLPLIRAVMAAEGKLLCSYPGPAIQIPTDIFMDECFLWELSSFLVQMDLNHLPPTPSTNFTLLCPQWRSSRLHIGVIGWDTQRIWSACSCGTHHKTHRRRGGFPFAESSWRSAHCAAPHSTKPRSP
jgi:hypothetical protein